MFSAQNDIYWQYISQYSGIILIWIIVIFVIIPYLIIKKKKRVKLKEISQIFNYPKIGKIFSTGLILVALMQIAFLSFISQKVNGVFPEARIIFGIGSFFLILSSFITTKKSPKLNQLFLRFYFILINIGAFLLSFSFAIFNFKLSIIGCYISATMLLGAIILRLSKKKIIAESWNLALSVIWIGTIYFMI